MPGPVFFFFAAVGLATLAVAVRFAFRPAERTLAVIRPLCAATTYSSLAAFFAGVVNGLMGLARAMDAARAAGKDPDLVPFSLGAMAEAPIALVLGFGMVAVAWLLVAVGLRRQA
jgi:hypothetical protein